MTIKSRNIETKTSFDTNPRKKLWVITNKNIKYI